MDLLQEFVKLSKYAGMREDLVQAGGGNTSVKLDSNNMLVKASGYNLAEINQDKGYSKINYSIIQDFFKINNELTLDDEKSLMEKALLDKSKPSIETFLHALTNATLTLHIHPTVVNILTASSDGMKILLKLFPAAGFVEYETPGIKLAKKLYSVITSNNKKEIFFLKNHGLIVCGNNTSEIINIVENIMITIENYIKIDMNEYKSVTLIADAINKITHLNNIVYTSFDKRIEAALIKNNGKVWDYQFCPDCLVYCGEQALYLGAVDNDEILNFYNNFGVPKIIVYKNKVYIYAENIKKAREIETVLAFSGIVATENIVKKLDLLSKKEINFLLNWDAEKYRQNIR